MSPSRSPTRRTWPRDRGKRPPRTHEFQLLVVHLGCTGEAGVGLPQFSTEPHPETYLVWGRGDLGHTVMGDWRIPYVWIGDGAKYAGPASPQLFFRCVLLSPTRLAVGIKFDASHGWNMREIDCSEFGTITGVWEIGPIISADRWIPDVLCRNLPQVKGPHPLMLGAGDPDHYRQTMTPVVAPKPEPAQPEVRVLRRLLRILRRRAAAVRGVFRRVQHPGLPRPLAGAGAVHADGHALASGILDAQAARAGAGHRVWAAGGSSLKLSDYPPPWEIETSFIAPDDTIPWNYWMNFIVLDKTGKNLGMWTPGVENAPKEKQHRPFRGGTLAVRFPRRGARVDPGRQAAGDAHPVRRRSHVRLGFRGSHERPLVPVRDLRRQGDPWVGDRRLRHALLEHDHRPHVRRLTGRPHVSEVSGRLRPLSLRALDVFREIRVALVICNQLFIRCQP